MHNATCEISLCRQLGHRLEFATNIPFPGLRMQDLSRYHENMPLLHPSIMHDARLQCVVKRRAMIFIRMYATSALRRKVTSTINAIASNIFIITVPIVKHRAYKIRVALFLQLARIEKDAYCVTRVLRPKGFNFILFRLN